MIMPGTIVTTAVSGCRRDGPSRAPIRAGDDRQPPALQVRHEPGRCEQSREQHRRQQGRKAEPQWQWKARLESHAGAVPTSAVEQQ
jgi:hypothetical protein